MKRVVLKQPEGKCRVCRSDTETGDTVLRHPLDKGTWVAHTACVRTATAKYPDEAQQRLTELRAALR